MTNSIGKYLDLIIAQNGSDIIFTVNEPPIVRVSTQIQRFPDYWVFDNDTLKQLANELLKQRRSKKQDESIYSIDLWYSHNDRHFRVNISKQSGSIMIVARLLMDYIPELDEMDNGVIFNELIKRPSGIILVAWPTGSGKSTLLASMIQKINQTRQKHIISIEDPIEYVYKNELSVIEQKELWSDISSFAAGLKSALRQNPDIILFGEMRDPESIKNAITLAETWHLVLSTIHSKSSGQTITKIVDSFPPNQQEQIKYQLSETLVSVISQRIIKSKDSNKLLFPQEIMINNSAISNCIRKNDIKAINNSILTNRNEGMQLLETSLVNMMRQWLIDQETAIENANNAWYITDMLE